MDFLEFNFGEDDIDRRLDKVIRKFLPDHSLSELYKLIRKGLIKINHKKTKENYHVVSGDTLQVADFLLNSKNERNTNASFIPEENQINIKDLIIFQNEHLLILNKPYDIKVHGDSSSLDSLVKDFYLSQGKNSSLSFSPGPLHRLDRKTTGLIAFSMSLKGARWFTQNIENHIIRKTYVGIVEGSFSGQEKWIDNIEKEDENSNKKSFHTVIQTENGKQALTTCTLEKKLSFSGKDLSLCRFDIETGRTHQIRSQCSIHGFPLYGDSAYKSKYKSQGNRDFYLHAWKLTFPKENPLSLPEEIICPPDFDIK